MLFWIDSMDCRACFSGMIWAGNAAEVIHYFLCWHCITSVARCRESVSVEMLRIRLRYLFFFLSGCLVVITLFSVFYSMQNRIYSGNAKARGYGTFCCDGSTSHWTNLFKNIFGLTGFGNQLSSDYTFCDFFFWL